MTKGLPKLPFHQRGTWEFARYTAFRQTQIFGISLAIGCKPEPGRRQLFAVRLPSFGERLPATSEDLAHNLRCDVPGVRGVPIKVIDKIVVASFHHSTVLQGEDREYQGIRPSHMFGINTTIGTDCTSLFGSGGPLKVRARGGDMAWPLHAVR